MLKLLINSELLRNDDATLFWEPILGGPLEQLKKQSNRHVFEMEFPNVLVAVGFPFFGGRGPCRNVINGYV